MEAANSDGSVNKHSEKHAGAGAGVMGIDRYDNLKVYFLFSKPPRVCVCVCVRVCVCFNIDR